MKIFANVFTLNFEITSWLVCSQISWPSYLMGCITPILLLKISSTSLSLRSSIRNAISSCKSTESRSPSSQISTFSALVSPFFPADCRQSGKEWLNLSLCKPFVSGTFLNYLCFWSFSCPLRPQKDLVSCLFEYQYQIVRWGTDLTFSLASNLQTPLGDFGSFSAGVNFYSLTPTLCHFSPAQVCLPLCSGYRHSVRPVGLPQSFPRFARCIGHTNIFSPCWAVLSKYPLCNIFFRWVTSPRMSRNNAQLLHWLRDTNLLAPSNSPNPLSFRDNNPN